MTIVDLGVTIAVRSADLSPQHFTGFCRLKSTLQTNFIAVDRGYMKLCPALLGAIDRFGHNLFLPDACAICLLEDVPANWLSLKLKTELYRKQR